MNKFAIALLGALSLAACDSGVPPRNQADTRVETATSTATAPNPSAAVASPTTAMVPATVAPAETALVTPTAAPGEASPQVSSVVVQTPPPALSSSTPEESPAAPFDPERACQKDSDCGLIPDDCRHCPPCAGTWRRAANRAAVKRAIKAQQAIVCPPIMCQRCVPRPALPGQPPVTSGYLGSSAECRAGQCVAKQ